MVLAPSMAGLPVRAALHPTGLFLALKDIDATQLTDAFMQQTVLRSKAAETYVQFPRAAPVPFDGGAPSGLVFHVGRCGSTALSQALKQHSTPVVYAEPLPVNEILLPPQAKSRQDTVWALRMLGLAFAQHAGRPYILKLTSWNSLYCDLFLEAFPNTPWVFLVRDPVEVGVSVMDQPPPWFQGADHAALTIARMVDPDSTATGREAFFSCLFASYCDRVAHVDRAKGLLVQHQTLASAVLGNVLPHLRLMASAAEQAKVIETLRRNAKADWGGADRFEDDSGAKRASASDALLQAAEERAFPSLRRLQAAFLRP